MTISGTDVLDAIARGVTMSDEALSVDLTNGRTITVPLAWFPRLTHGTSGVGVHWADLDEDISMVSLLAGRKSGECQALPRRWLGGTEPSPGSRGALHRLAQV